MHDRTTGQHLMVIGDRTPHAALMLLAFLINQVLEMACPVMQQIFAKCYTRANRGVGTSGACSQGREEWLPSLGTDRSSVRRNGYRSSTLLAYRPGTESTTISVTRRYSPSPAGRYEHNSFSTSVPAILLHAFAPSSRSCHSELVTE